MSGRPRKRARWPGMLALTLGSLKRLAATPAMLDAFDAAQSAPSESGGSSSVGAGCAGQVNRPYRCRRQALALRTSIVTTKRRFTPSAYLAAWAPQLSQPATRGSGYFYSRSGLPPWSSEAIDALFFLVNPLKCGGPHHHPTSGVAG